MVDARKKKDFSVADLPVTWQTALLGGDGVNHSGFSVPLDENKRRNTVINCQGQFDELATMVTIAFNLKRLGPTTAATVNDVPPIVAHVSWGVDGARMDVDVDVVNGTMIALPASSLRVDVEIDLPADAADFGSVQVGAVMGYMPRGQHDAQRTLSAELAAAEDPPVASGTALIAVPEFAKNVTFLIEPTATFQLEQLADSAGALVLSTIAAVAPAVPPTVVFPLSNRTRYLRLTNTGGADVLVSAVFGLAV